MQNKLVLGKDEPVEEVISDIIQEERTISDRRKNICVFNMRCTNNDARSFSALCSQQLGLDESALLHRIISVRRMNTVNTKNRHNDVGRPGPLIIRFSSAECKSDILENAHKLSNFYDQGSILKIFTTHDLTPRQQAKKKALRAELFRRRQNGERVFFGDVTFTRLTTASLSTPQLPPQLISQPHPLPYPAQS